MPSIEQIKANPDMLRTARKVTELFRQNTGIHPLDSGMDFGRAWQRNQRFKDWEAFAARPEAGAEISDTDECRCERDGHEHVGTGRCESRVRFRCWCTGATDEDGELIHPEVVDYLWIDGWHYLVERFEYSKKWQKRFDKWVEENSDSRTPHLEDMRSFAAELAESEGRRCRTWNTYNDQTLFNETFQMVTIEGVGKYGEDLFLLQYHGGADVRGGYTSPIALLGRDGYWWDVQNAEVYCTRCDLLVSKTGQEFLVNDWSDGWDEYFEHFDWCPRCGLTDALEVSQPNFDSSSY